MAHKTIVDHVEVEPGGRILVRLVKQRVVDGVAESRFHRTAIEPGGDIDAQMRAVNLHLTETGREKYAPVEDWSAVHRARAGA